MHLQAPIKKSNASLLQESVMIGDFGQFYATASLRRLPACTAVNYLPSETRFEERCTGAPRTGLEADVWASGCAIRAGCPLFESFFRKRRRHTCTLADCRDPRTIALIPGGALLGIGRCGSGRTANQRPKGLRGSNVR